MLRVLKPTGILYLALPDKRCCFDADQPVSLIEHLMRDHFEGPEWFRREHFEEWVRLVTKSAEDDIDGQVAKLMSMNYSIHYHVWTPFEMIELILALRRLAPFEMELCFENRVLK